MSPENITSARLEHWLDRVLGEYVDYHELGEVMAAEVLVRLPEQRTDRVPDLLFVAKEHADRVKPTHIDGPPDLCIEIVSPASQARDWREKYLEYEAAGVREYWVIDPMSQRAEFYTLEPEEHRQDARGTTGQDASDGAGATGQAGSDTPRYVRLPEADGAVTSRVLPRLKLPVEWLWKDTRPKVLDALRELGVIG